MALYHSEKIGGGGSKITQITPITWRNSISEHDGGCVYAVKAQHNLLKVADEVIVSNSSFGLQLTILPTDYIEAYKFNGYSKMWRYVYSQNTTLTTEGNPASNTVLFYWNKTNGTIEQRVIKWRTDVWAEDATLHFPPILRHSIFIR